MYDLPLPLLRIRERLETGRESIIEALDAMADGMAAARPATDAWSVAETVEHLLLAEAFTVDLTHSLVGDSAVGFPPDLADFAPLPAPVSMESPPPIRPRSVSSVGQLRTLLMSTSERSLAAMETLARVDPREFVAPHPLFGPLDLGQWWVLNATHYEMHLAQVREAIGRLGRA